MGAQPVVGNAGVARGVEDRERVGESVAGEREHRLVHHDDRGFGVRGRPARGVPRQQLEHRRAAGREGGLTRRHRERERAGARRHGELRLPLANAGRSRQLARLAPPGASSRGAAPTRSTWTWTFGVKPPRSARSSVVASPPHRKRSSRTRPERRTVRTPSAGKNGARTRILGDVARLVLLAVGHRGHRLLLDSAALRRAAARHPELGARVSFSRPRASAHARQDAQDAALLGPERELRRLVPGAERRSSRSCSDLLPLAPLLTDSSRSRAGSTGAPAAALPSRSVAITSTAISIALREEGPFAAEADVAIRGWTRSNAVAVHAWRLTSVTEASRRDEPRPRRVRRLEVDAQTVHAAPSVRAANGLVALGARAFRGGKPPRHESGRRAKSSRFGGGSRPGRPADVPRDVGAPARAAAGVVGGADADGRGLAGEVRPGARPPSPRTRVCGTPAPRSRGGTRRPASRGRRPRARAEAVPRLKVAAASARARTRRSGPRPRGLRRLVALASR